MFLNLASWLVVSLIDNLTLKWMDSIRVDVCFNRNKVTHFHEDMKIVPSLPMIFSYWWQYMVFTKYG